MQDGLRTYAWIGSFLFDFILIRTNVRFVPLAPLVTNPWRIRPGPALYLSVLKAFFRVTDTHCPYVNASFLEFQSQ